MRAQTFLTRDEVVQIHEDQIQRYGGSLGVRDETLLESAIAMPQMSFAGQQLHASIPEMAAAYLFHLVKDHPFIDGNKRTGAAVTVVFLKLNGHELTAPESEFQELVLAAAASVVNKQAVTEFFRRYARQRTGGVP